MGGKGFSRHWRDVSEPVNYYSWSVICASIGLVVNLPFACVLYLFSNSIKFLLSSTLCCFLVGWGWGGVPLFELCWN